MHRTILLTVFSLISFSNNFDILRDALWAPQDERKERYSFSRSAFERFISLYCHHYLYCKWCSKELSNLHRQGLMYQYCHRMCSKSTRTRHRGVCMRGKQSLQIHLIAYQKGAQSRWLSWMTIIFFSLWSSLNKEQVYDFFDRLWSYFITPMVFWWLLIVGTTLQIRPHIVQPQQSWCGNSILMQFMFLSGLILHKAIEQ